MQFPVGLRARLMWRELRGASSNKPLPGVFHLSPLVQDFPAGARMETVSAENEWHTPVDCVKAAAQGAAPAVWLGGTEPLLHPEIGEVASALTSAGYYAFLHTRGFGLRKGIHEFKPVSRFYFCVEVPLEDSATEASDPAGQFSAVTEAIRVSRLSGFHVCIHVSSGTGASLHAIAARLNAVRAMHVEGVVVSSGGAFAGRGESAFVAAAFSDAVRLIPTRGWRAFSRILEASYQPGANAVSPAPSRHQAQQTDACEESA